MTVGEIYHQPIEGFYYSAINDDLVLVYFDDGMRLVFEKNPYEFRLSAMQWDNQFSVGLNYHHVVHDQTYLSDIVVLNDNIR